MGLKIVECRSPNHDSRPDGGAIDILVLHYTGMKTADEALKRLCDPAARVSAHYTIDRDGSIYRHVEEHRRAWHAGVSYWAGETNVNARSIGIELVNPGHEFGYEPFPKEQIGALLDLCDGIFDRHDIAPERVVGHSDVAPARKEDPGELFPWKQLADYGIGLWPEQNGKYLRDPVDVALSRFGYGVPPHADVPLDKVIAAFQRHFRPASITGEWDNECGRLLANLLDKAAVSAAAS